jgi:hypothetical protein
MAKGRPLRFISGNYIDRVNDAVFVEIGETTVYFADRKVIAMYAHDALYRVNALDSGIMYKRVRSAMLRHKPRKVHEMKREDLNAMVEAAIMTMASKLVDEKLGLETA